MDPLGSQDEMDARVEQLWRKLDPQNKGEIDLDGLQRGLKKIDHPLKNAHGMLEDVLKAVDTSGDGKIQYEEFRVFVEHTEKELLLLFQSIDRDHNGRLDKDELQAAFKKAGLTVPAAKLDQFFSEVDTDHDGSISFDEWRNFLLFLPADAPGLKAVLSYYSSTVTLNAEGDTQFQSIDGLGTIANFLSVFFGSIVRIAFPPPSRSFASGPNIDLDLSGDISQHTSLAPSDFELFEDDSATDSNIAALNQSQPNLSNRSDSVAMTNKKLTWLLPDPGYFAAGGIAGVVSRTATAPLDRLKVYLIANTGEVAKDSINAVKKGDTVAAAKHVGRPLINATKDLWRAGGMRSLFAGNGLNVLKVMPESAIKFGSYEAAKRALAHLEGHGDTSGISGLSQFIAGGLGGMVSQLCVYPLDTLKFRMQSNMEAKGLRGNALILSTAKEMIRTGGFLSAYRGLTMGLVGMFPYSAIDLATFEFLKTQLITYNSTKMKLPKDDPKCLPGSFATGAIGAFSGSVGASIVYPINLLRTRLQLQGTVHHPQTYTGVVDCFTKTVSKEGFRGLFKGITPNLLKVVPAVSITYVVYENTKKVLNLR